VNPRAIARMAAPLLVLVGLTMLAPLLLALWDGQMRSAIESAVSEGCEVLAGGVEAIDKRAGDAGNFVEPTIIRVPKGKTPKITCEETFAPILYVFDVDSLDDAIAMQNGVDQGLSSAIFTDSMRAAEKFLSPAGADCGIDDLDAMATEVGIDRRVVPMSG